MITFKEVLHGHALCDMPHQHEVALEDLIKRVNIVAEAWQKPMIVTSGYRSTLDQERINPKVKHSAHMIGCAVDILDEGLQLTDWLKNNPTGITKLEQAGLYCEAGNKNWVHFQSYAPKSGHRWFLP